MAARDEAAVGERRAVAIQRGEGSSSSCHISAAEPVLVWAASRNTASHRFKLHFELANILPVLERRRAPVHPSHARQRRLDAQARERVPLHAQPRARNRLPRAPPRSTALLVLAYAGLLGAGYLANEKLQTGARINRTLSEVRAR